MPTLLASGRAADVYAIGDGRVLRRYRNGIDVAAEAAVMAHVSARGFPAPAVYRADNTDLELQRLDGPTLAQAVLTGEVDVGTAATLLARLHTQLHELPPLRSARHGDTVLHLDLHPENVILTARGPFLIDWTNAADGPPDLDVAISALILAQVATDTDAEPTLTGAVTELLTAFVGRVEGHPGRSLDRAAELREADPNLTSSEREHLNEAVALLRTCI